MSAKGERGRWRRDDCECQVWTIRSRVRALTNVEDGASKDIKARRNIYRAVDLRRISRKTMTGRGHGFKIYKAPSILFSYLHSSRFNRSPSQRTLKLLIHPCTDKPTPNIPQPLNLNHPLPNPARLSLEKGSDSIHGIGEHAPRQLSGTGVAVVFNGGNGSTVRP